MSDINRRELIKKLSWYCFICNYFEERGKGTLCGQKKPEIVNGKIVKYDECIFCRNSSTKAGQPSRVGLKQSVFLSLGVTKKTMSEAFSFLQEYWVELRKQSIGLNLTFKLNYHEEKTSNVSYS